MQREGGRDGMLVAGGTSSSSSSLPSCKDRGGEWVKAFLPRTTKYPPPSTHAHVSNHHSMREAVSMQNEI